MASENTREIVLDMLLAVEREEEYSHRLAARVLDRYAYLPARDRAFIKRLFEGTLERRIELDYRLDGVSSLPVRKMKPLIRNLLRMSAYQILYMDGVPDAAAVNEGVRLAGKRGFSGLKAFVNGSLRRLSAEKDTVEFPSEQKEPERFLSVAYSMPEWIVRHFLETYSYEETKALLESFLRVRPVMIRFAAGVSEEEKRACMQDMEQAGMVLRPHELVRDGWYLEGCDNISRLKGFAEGLFTVQDASSMLAVAAAGIRKGDRVLDVCAAPGGKTLLAAEYTGDTGYVEARDISESRLERLRENLSRMKLSNVGVKVWDAALPDAEWFEKADVVLADVPCSGLGVMGRKRDIKYRQSSEGMQSLITLQRKILKQAAAYVKPGGTLLYSTCTINRKENEEQADWLCREFGFEKENMEGYLPAGIPCKDTAKEGCLQLLPHRHHTDGFFFSRLKKPGKKDIKSMTLEELTEDMSALSQKGFRAKQCFEWMHKKLARGFDEMTNLSKDFRAKCGNTYEYTALRTVETQESKEDGTKKFLFALSDKNMVESVLMPYKYGNSVCISSQVGCRMGCRFCASTLDGLERNLKASEMLEQVYEISRITGERVSHVVVMGTGEPLDNYDNLLRFIRLLNDENGLHISQRNITVSTCGLVPEMYRLAEEALQITLALSLHGATDEKRRQLMPVANKYSIHELMAACRYYFEKTGRRITFEYSLVAGVNDTDEDAAALAGLAGELGCHVNLIPVNPIKERDFVQSAAPRVLSFKNRLEKNKINVTIRREMGRDIDGACGQLRRRHMDAR